MHAIDRRTFLKASAATLTSAAFTLPAEAAPGRWKKAYMLGGLSNDSILREFRLLKEAGFEGVEISSPNDLDRDVVLRARDETGLVIHGVCCSRHWQDTLSDPDPAVHQPAAIAWSRWESSTITLLPQAETIARFTAPEYATAFARIENHYFRHGGWWDEGQLIRDAHRLRGIPAVIVQGRYDMCTPMMTAWDLHRAWPEADLRIVADAGHSALEPGIVHELVEATDRFR